MAPVEEDQDSAANEKRDTVVSDKGSGANQEPAAEDDYDQPDYDPPGRDVILIFAVFFEGGLAPFSLFLGWILGYPPLASFAWEWRDALLGAAAGVPLAFAFWALMRLPLGPLQRFQKFCDEEVTPLFAKSYWSEIGLVALSAGVGEEMLFRGVLQTAFCAWLGTRWGIAITSIVFGLLHPISITYVLYAGCIGFYLGAIFHFNENLLTVMVTHAVYDFAALGYLIRIRAGDDSAESD